MPLVRTLSLHRSYHCGRSGHCCTSNWPISIEADGLSAVRAALANGRLKATDGGDAFAEEDGGTALLAVRGHACVFFDAHGTRACGIQEALGHDALPLACRQFPRVSVSDPRGVSVTLSHYCPTARAMLERDAAIDIVSDASFPESGEYVGLDARASLPPLLRPDVLMDWDTWWEWERLAIARIGATREPIQDTLAALGAAVEHVREWTPGTGDLMARVRASFAEPSRATARPRPEVAGVVKAVMAAIPADIRPTSLPAGERPSEVALRGLVAAHAFANWTAHLGRGLRSWLRSLEAVAALVEAGCGIREVDLLLRHLADPGVLADSWSEPDGVGP
jgi:hypothetical protein